MHNGSTYLQIRFRGYIPGNSTMHLIDPRIKLLMLLIVVIGSVVLNSITSVLVLLVFVLILIPLSGLKLRYILSPLLPFIPFLLLVVVLRLVSGDSGDSNSKVIVRIWKITITESGVLDSILLILRFFSIYNLFILIVSTTRSEDFIKAVESLMHPLQKLKIPVNEFIMVINIAIRFFHILLKEMNRVIKAQVSRGADFNVRKINFFKKLKSMMPLFIPLFVFSIEYTKVMTEVLVSRNYRGGRGRTYYRSLSLIKRDYIFMFISLTVLGVSIAVKNITDRIITGAVF